jgi:pimeloyl-ACP methyl ester carboxylesterase
MARRPTPQIGFVLSFFIAAALAVAPQSLPAATPQALGIGLESYAYPYPVHFLPLRLEGQDLRMGYMDVPAKAAANGRTVVLMHGKNFGGYYWLNVIDALTAAGYRVVVPDQIGWGKSSKPDIRYSFHMLAANTAHLLDTLGVGNVDVVGHSTGCMLAVRFTLLYPERVTHLALEGPVGLEDYRLKVPAQTDEKLYEDELNTTVERFQRVYSHYFFHPDPKLWEPLADVAIRVMESGEWPRWAKASALASQMIYQQPVRYEYHLLQPPTLLLVGDHDQTAPLSGYAPPDVRSTMGHIAAMAKVAVKEIPHGSVFEFLDCGHIPHIEYPKVFNETLLKFLGS